MRKITYSAKPFDTIEELTLSKFNFGVGDIVDLQGYYEAGDGAHHKRKIAPADDGSGVQLYNGLWANIVHNGEVFAGCLGLKGDGSTENSVFLESRLKFLKEIKLVFGDGVYLFDELDLKNTPVNFTSVFDKMHTENVNGNLFRTMPKKTIFAAYRHDQEFVLKIGVAETHLRGVSLKNILIMTNVVKKTPELFIEYNLGAKIGLILENVCFSTVDKLVFTGHNPNLVTAYSFLGFEVQQDDLMFRWVGSKSLGEPHYKGCFYIRHSDNPLTQASGMTLSKLGFERCAPPYIDVFSAVDVIFDNINIENNLMTDDATVQVDPEIVENFENIANKLPLFQFGTYISGGVIFNNITGQNLGISYLKNGKYYTYDTVFKNMTEYGGNGNITISNVSFQHSRKDITVIASNGTNPNKVGNNLRRTEKYMVRNVQIGYQEEHKTRNVLYDIKDSVFLDIDENSKFASRQMYSESVKIADILNCNLTYENNRFRTRVRYDKSLRREIVLPAFEKTIPEEENVIFETDKLYSCYTDYTTKEDRNVAVKVTSINNQWADTTTEVVFVCDDGSLIKSGREYLFKSETGTTTTIFDLIVPANKKIKEFYIANTASTYRYAYISDITITSKKQTEVFDKINFNDKVSSGFKSNLDVVDINSLKTKDIEGRSIKVMSINKSSQNLPDSTNHYMLINYNGGNSASVDGTATQLLVQESTGKLFTRTIVGSKVTVREYQQITLLSSLDTPYCAYKMQQEGIYSDFMSYADEQYEHERQQRELEEQRQLEFDNREDKDQSYEDWLSTQPQLMPFAEPQPSQALLDFKKKYLG